MGPEVLLFAGGLYLGWFVFGICLLLCIPRTTRKFAAPVLAVAAVGGVIGVLSTNWGVPWVVSFPLVFVVAAIPTAVISCIVALALCLRSTKVRDDAS